MTAAAPVEIPKKAPTAVEVDELCKRYSAQKDKWLQAKLVACSEQDILERQADELRELTLAFGGSHAEKSQLLHGVKFEVMVTKGVTTSLDAAAVDRFREALQKENQSRLLKKLFEKTIKWTYNPMAAVIVRGEKLSQKLLALYSQCEVAKPQTPKLQVREKAA